MKTHPELDTFRDSLANRQRRKETGRGQGWEPLDEGVKDYWREDTLWMLEFMAEKGMMIQTAYGAMKLKDLM